MSIPEFMGDTPEERIKTYIAYKNAGIRLKRLDKHNKLNK